jgi:hypothetical protein
MAQTTLRLDFLDVYGDPLEDSVDLFLSHRVLDHRPVVRDVDGSKRLNVTGLKAANGGLYSALVFPRRHRPVSRFVRVRDGKITSEVFTLPVDPKQVTEMRGPDFADLPEKLRFVLGESEIEGYPNLRGEALYEAFDDIRKAGLLNICAKMRATTFRGEQSVLSYVSSLTRLRGDRFFAHVEKELRDATKTSVADGLFREVNGGLHTPPPGYQRVDSYKTDDRYGNLQLTFFANPATLEFVVDADIDDASGLEHVFQVLGNAINGPTHPYDIHEILVAFQKIDPGYRLVT